jgi:hypothetical protein
MAVARAQAPEFAALYPPNAEAAAPDELVGVAWCVSVVQLSELLAGAAFAPNAAAPSARITTAIALRDLFMVKLLVGLRRR